MFFLYNLLRYIYNFAIKCGENHKLLQVVITLPNKTLEPQGSSRLKAQTLGGQKSKAFRYKKGITLDLRTHGDKNAKSQPYPQESFKRLMISNGLLYFICQQPVVLMTGVFWSTSCQLLPPVWPFPFSWRLDDGQPLQILRVVCPDRPTTFETVVQLRRIWLCAETEAKIFCTGHA